MGRMKTPGGDHSEVRLKIEKMGATLKELAIWKVQALQMRINKSEDSLAYRQQAMNERMKGQQLQHVLYQLDERKKNPPAKVRRMDPLGEYDKDMVVLELSQAQNRAQEFDQMSADYAQEAAVWQSKEVELDTRLRKLNASGLLREAEEILPNGNTR